MILEEGHRSRLSIHPGATKMYKDLKKIFWWPKMKKDVAKFVLTKSAHFIPINLTYSMERLAEIYIKEIMKLHGIPPSIVSDRDLSFHSSIGMDPLEALYGRRCRTPLCWFETGDNLVLGPEIVQHTIDKVKMIQEKMRAFQNRVGWALKMRNLALRFIGPYDILKRVGNVAYQIALPPSLSNLHSVFHVSQLRKYVFDLSHVIESDKVQIKENLTFETLTLRTED
ncbi:uncharacterized protein [Cicer arietinum]|uniref:Uncharacterized protein LOC113784110 n=1 Tax=Cicer arietinum TaxID=3827 RepID=A0A3Q7YAX7_CICAR|nr:uncharacterized protein LOC113784110 [Cicer arietinum]